MQDRCYESLQNLSSDELKFTSNVCLCWVGPLLFPSVLFSNIMGVKPLHAEHPLELYCSWFAGSQSIF